MGLNPFRRKAEEQRSILDLPWSTGGPGASPSVTVARAMRLGPVVAAGRVLASTISSLPIDQYRGVGSNKTSMPLGSLFRSPSVIGTTHDWVFRLVTSMVYRGNGVGYITSRDYYEFPTSIEWLNPDDVQVVDNNISGRGSYTQPIWYVHGVEVDPEDIVHIPWFPMANRNWGLDPLGAFAASVKSGLGAQDYASDWFDKGGVPTGTFQNEAQTIAPGEADALRRRFVDTIRKHEPLVYGKDWTYTPIEITPHQAQFIETMKLSANQIAAIYGLPPDMIGGEQGHSMRYTNVEMDSINFVTFTLLPWLTKIEAAFSKLLPQPQYVKFNVDALIRTDIATRFATYKIGREIGVMSANQIRSLEDWEKLPEGQKGDDFTPLTQVGSPFTPTNAANLRDDQQPVHLRAVRGTWDVDDESQRAIGDGS